MAHTKGPWKVWDKTSVVINNTERPRSHEYICQTAGINAESDARLVAAAPELLQECQRSLDMLLDWSKSDAWKRADPGFVNMKWRLENVIKKAKHGGD